jgi:para-aminobenzoate synthetase
MILEGVSALRREFRDYVSLGIFVDTPRETCFRRGVQRDLVTGKPVAEIERMWAGWAADEDRYLAAHDPLGQADLVIDGTRPVGEQIRF